MKSYKTMLLELKTKQPKGDVVLKKKINGIPVLIVKDTGSLPFVVYIDGDKLDTFRSEGDAKKAITAALKELP